MAKKEMKKGLKVKLNIRKREIVEFLKNSKCGKWLDILFRFLNRKEVILFILSKLFEKIVDWIFNLIFN